MIPGLPERNPGLKLANAFSVRIMQPLQGCEKVFADDYDPGFQSKPWAEISERFQRWGHGTSARKLRTIEAIDYQVINGLNIGRAGLSSVSQITISERGHYGK